MMPRVYVGIPTRNRPEFVRNAMRSVLDQTYTNLRVLVTDNDSDSEIADDVRKFIANLADPRIAYVYNPVADGERGQTLYNFSRCEEPYFLLLHDDDRLQPTLVERAVETLEADPRLAFFSTAQNLIDEQDAVLLEESVRYNQWLGRHRLPSGPVTNVLEVILQGGAFSMSGTVFRQTTMARLGFVDPGGGGFPIDMITYLRIGEDGQLGYFASERLVDYRWHAGQSRVKHENWTFNEWMIEKYVVQLETRRYHGRAEQLRRRLLSLGLCRLGIVRHVANDTGAARALFRRAVAISPSTWQGWAYCGIGHLLPFAIAPKWGRRVTLRHDAA
ncbi:MAG: glycosyltransferase family 2 protein [Gammaproteobacteria bacterium]|nr:glycosyltransferase family 2 protein [Gammaproteobacteria bacterium]